MKKILALTGAAALLTIGVSSTVSADRAYHTERVSLQAIDDAPLRSGSVVNIHANGPKVYAQERYLLNGALPNHEYMIVLSVHLFEPDCAGPAAPFFDVPISTNAAGNGQAKAPTIPPEAVEGLAGEHGVNWIVYDDGAPLSMRLVARTSSSIDGTAELRSGGAASGLSLIPLEITTQTARRDTTGPKDTHISCALWEVRPLRGRCIITASECARQASEIGT